METFLPGYTYLATGIAATRRGGVIVKYNVVLSRGNNCSKLLVNAPAVSKTFNGCFVNEQLIGQLSAD